MRATPGYDEWVEMLGQTLATEQPRVRVAFAVACAERLFPLFEAYAATSGASGAEVLRTALDLAWLDATGEGQTWDSARSELLTSLVELLPNTETASVEAYSAEDAVAAASFALQAAKTHDIQEVIWAARRALERASSIALPTISVDVNDPHFEEALDSSMWVREELDRQYCDLETLTSHAGEWSECLAVVRERASTHGRELAREEGPGQGSQ